MPMQSRMQTTYNDHAGGQGMILHSMRHQKYGHHRLLLNCSVDSPRNPLRSEVAQARAQISGTKDSRQSCALHCWGWRNRSNARADARTICLLSTDWVQVALHSDRQHRHTDLVHASLYFRPAMPMLRNGTASLQARLAVYQRAYDS